MNPLEIAGTVLGLANIVLLIRRSIWNFPVAMAMVTCIGIVLFEAKLYAETGLQAFFFVVNAWGWWLWSRARRQPGGADGDVPVGWMRWRARVAWAAATAALSVALGLSRLRTKYLKSVLLKLLQRHGPLREVLGRRRDE